MNKCSWVHTFIDIKPQSASDKTLPKRHCEGPIVEAVNTIIYAAPRSDVKELLDVREQLIIKYGKEFAMAAMDNKHDIVNPRVTTLI